MTERYVDVHCHTLPGVDEGAKDMNETGKMLRIAYDEGIRAIIATPDCHPIRGHSDKKIVKEKLGKVWKVASEIDENFCIYAGSDVFSTKRCRERLPREKSCG